MLPRFPVRFYGIIAKRIARDSRTLLYMGLAVKQSSASLLLGADAIRTGVFPVKRVDIQTI
jgi:hypothetical protein